jgi:hypothetical protein
MNLPALVIINLITFSFVFRDDIKKLLDAKMWKNIRIKSKVIKAMKQPDVSILDYIMGVENMSERDRVWYDLYKSYGNRNHTWQDFRDMFNDDIVYACKTLQNWKTWNEINPIRHETSAQILNLLSKNNIEFINNQPIGAIRSYLIEAFNNLTPISYNAESNYCTFNPRIAKIQRKYKGKIQNPQCSAKYITELDPLVDLRNADFVIGERIENYLKIILDNPDIIQQIQDCNLPMNKKICMVRNILDASARIHGSYPSDVILKEPSDNYAAYNRNSNDVSFNESFARKRSLSSMLSSLVHEDNHKIDYTNPDFGLLGSQIMKYEQDIYIHKTKKPYYKRSTEQSSYFIDDIISLAIRKAISQKQK